MSKLAGVGGGTAFALIVAYHTAFVLPWRADHVAVPHKGVSADLATVETIGERTKDLKARMLRLEEKVDRLLARGDK